MERGNYDLVYTAPLPETGSIDGRLHKLFEQFNFHRPADFHSPSMSVSDIVAIKRDGVVSCHYCDSVGFQEIPGFLPSNPLKNAEMTVEDDYGMIDGIINNGPKATVAELEAQARSGQPHFPDGPGRCRPPGGTGQEKICDGTAPAESETGAEKDSAQKERGKGALI